MDKYYTSVDYRKQQQRNENIKTSIETSLKITALIVFLTVFFVLNLEYRVIILYAICIIVFFNSIAIAIYLHLVSNNKRQEKEINDALERTKRIIKRYYFTKVNYIYPKIEETDNDILTQLIEYQGLTFYAKLEGEKNSIVTVVAKNKNDVYCVLLLMKPIDFIKHFK